MVSTYIALLRGINVSGKNLLKMGVLRSELAHLGFSNIQTYIQSGNIVFTAPIAPEIALSSQIAELLLKNHSLKVPTLVASLAKWQQIVQNIPFSLPKSPLDVKTYHLSLLAHPPTTEQIKVWETLDFLPDTYAIIGKAVYLHCPNGYAHTKLNNNYIEKSFKTTSTTRNWVTVTTLLQMAEQTQT